MWQAVRENPRAVTYAVLMHVGLLILLVFSLDWTPKSVTPGTTRPIQAELVDMSKLREIEAQKKAEQQRIEAEKRKQVQEKQRKVEAEKQRKAEQEKKRKAVAEKQRKADVERKRKAEQAVKRKAAAERKQKAEQAAKQKAAAERKQKAEQAAKKKAEAERKKKAAAAAEAARQREAEQALQAQLAEEAAQARAQSALSEFIPYIQEKVQNNWLRPAGSPPGLSCVIQVTLIPGGEVVGTRVVRSSGNQLFDASVERAVQKASPLPLPADSALFKYFREINFNFVPD